MTNCSNDLCLTSDGTQSRFPISIFIERQLPNWVAEDHPKFILFLEAYYEWLEQTDNHYAQKYCLLRNLDVDTAVDEFLEFFKREYLHNIPESLYKKSGCEEVEFSAEDGVFDYRFDLPTNENSEIKVYVDDVLQDASQYSINAGCGNGSRILFDESIYDTVFPSNPVIKIEVCENVEVDVRLLIKIIKDLSTKKGTEASYRYLFKLLYNEDIDIEYPNQLILKASDGKWVKENTIPISKNILTVNIASAAEVVNGFSVKVPQDKIESVRLNGIPVSYQYLNGKVIVDSAVVSDVIDIYYLQENAPVYTNFTFPVTDITQKVYILPKNITPAPTQSQCVLLRNSITVPNNYYKIEEYLVGTEIRTAFVLVDYTEAVVGDTFTFKVETGVSSTPAAVLGETYTVAAKIPLKYNTGLNFDQKVSPVTVVADGVTLNSDTIQEDFTNQTGTVIVMATTKWGLGSGLYSVVKNGNLLQNGVDYTVSGKTITFSTALVPNDEIVIVLSPSYTLKDEYVNGVKNIVVVFDSACEIDSWTSFVVSYKPKVIQGYYKEEDGKLSSTNVLQDSYKYQQFSYIIKSEQTTDQYGQFLKNLLHPAGMIMFGEITLEQCISWMIGEYKYYVEIQDIAIESTNRSSIALGPRWRSFEINKFDYGLTSQNLMDTIIESVENELIGDAVDKPDNGIDLLMDSRIIVSEVVPPPPPPVLPFPPLFIGGNF